MPFFGGWKSHESFLDLCLHFRSKIALRRTILERDSGGYPGEIESSSFDVIFEYFRRKGQSDLPSKERRSQAVLRLEAVFLLVWRNCAQKWPFWPETRFSFAKFLFFAAVWWILKVAGSLHASALPASGILIRKSRLSRQSVWTSVLR